MSRRLLPRGDLDTSFPRVSGDEPEAIHERGHDELFSPRERG